MNKNWLIRTKSNHILGPISKDKVVELYQNGSIKADDEVCSGNGFWFFIREEDLVQKYLMGDDLQVFNPISEAKDILTVAGPQSRMSETQSEDITMVGGINLSLLKNNIHDKAGSPPDVPIPNVPVKDAKIQAVKETVPSETKKKNDIVLKPEIKKIAPSHPLKKQDWLKYLGILGFIVLFFLIYFRKPIIEYLFKGEMTSHFPSIIEVASAQDGQSGKKKRLLESFLAIDGVEFKPTIGLNGFTVTSSFDIEKISCAVLSNDSHQLGILLYPTDLFNEKFLIKIRDCILKLPDSNVLKKWIKLTGKLKNLSKEQHKEKVFLNEVIQSKFNLITDLKMKSEIIQILGKIPENTVAETLLKSYLYLMVGNITRSDNLLRQIINTSPRVNWEKTLNAPSFYHDLVTEQAHLILTKLANHPADRKSFQLLVLYLRSFYNKDEIIELADHIDTSDIESKINLRVIEGLAPYFVKYLRLDYLKEGKKIQRLRNLKKSPLDYQAYWVWAFIDIDPLISNEMTTELEKIEKSDQLWFIYLLSNERLSDLYSKNMGKSFLPGRRKFLKENLDQKETFMLALYKLIEIGDINPELVQKTISHLSHE